MLNTVFTWLVHRACDTAVYATSFLCETVYRAVRLWGFIIQSPGLIIFMDEAIAELRQTDAQYEARMREVNEKTS
jgi:hypothetical protein